MYVLDTNILSALLGEEPNALSIAATLGALRRANSLCVHGSVYAELLAALLNAGGGRALAEELFRIPAYLERLDLAPERDTLCLLYCVQDTQLPPGVALSRTQTPLHAMLAAWLGAEALPSDDEIGAYFRAQHRFR